MKYNRPSNKIELPERQMKFFKKKKQDFQLRRIQLTELLINCVYFYSVRACMFIIFIYFGPSEYPRKTKQLKTTKKNQKDIRGKVIIFLCFFLSVSYRGTGILSIYIAVAP